MDRWPSCFTSWREEVRAASETRITPFTIENGKQAQQSHDCPIKFFCFLHHESRNMNHGLLIACFLQTVRNASHYR